MEQIDQRVNAMRHIDRVYKEKQRSEDGSEVTVGIVEGYLATWDIDRSGDQFVKGAFSESVRELQSRGRPLRLKRNHNQLIGGFPASSLREDNTGLFGRAEINLEGELGREAYSLALQGVLSDFSVGVSMNLSDMRTQGEVRQILKATVWECSLVDEPMNPAAVATMVRGYNMEPTPGIERENLYAAAATLALSEDRSQQEVDTIDELYERIGWISPFVRGCWSLPELRGLPKSLRRGIIRTEVLSRDAIDAIVDALQSTQETGDVSSKEHDWRQEIVDMVIRKEIAEDTMTRINEVLDRKADAVQAARAICTKGDWTEDDGRELAEILTRDQESSREILAMITDDSGDAEDKADGIDDETKAFDDLSSVLTGAWK